MDLIGQKNVRIRLSHRIRLLTEEISIKNVRFVSISTKKLNTQRIEAIFKRKFIKLGIRFEAVTKHFERLS
jgi:hypothetical protein